MFKWVVVWKYSEDVLLLETEKSNVVESWTLQISEWATYSRVHSIEDCWIISEAQIFSVW